MLLCEAEPEAAMVRAHHPRSPGPLGGAAARERPAEESSALHRGHPARGQWDRQLGNQDRLAALGSLGPQRMADNTGASGTQALAVALGQASSVRLDGVQADDGALDRMCEALGASHFALDC